MSTPPEGLSEAYIERAYEPLEEVVMPRPVIETHGLQPEDIGVLACVLLLPEGALETAKDMAAYMREKFGWKMSEDRFSTIGKRLEKAGHMERVNGYNPDTKRPEKRLRFYRNPSNNPAYTMRGALEASQVGAEIRENPASASAGASEDRENRVSQGQSREPEKAGSGTKTGKTGFRRGRVSAGQSREPEKAGFGTHPPHPPEVVVTTSPYPLTDGAHQHPSQTEGEEGTSFATEEIAAAESFLLRFERPWTVGGATARKLAPYLLETMRKMEWPGIEDVDRDLLKANLLTAPPEKFRAASIVRIRIGDLPLYETVDPRRQAAAASTRRRFTGSGL